MPKKKQNQTAIIAIIIAIIVVLIIHSGQYKVKLISKDSRENMIGGFETLTECETYSVAVWKSNGEYCKCGFCDVYSRIEASCRTSSLENAKSDFEYFCKGTTPTPPVIGKDIKLLNVDTPTKATKGSKAVVTIKVVNEGDATGSIYVEAGIYADDFLDGKGDYAREASLKDITQCGGAGESFVDAVKIEDLKPGEQFEFKLNPSAPTKDSRLKDGTLILKSNMDIIVGLYEQCGGGYLEGQMVRGNILLEEPQKEEEEKVDYMAQLKEWYNQNKYAVWGLSALIIFIIIMFVFKDEKEE